MRSSKLDNRSVSEMAAHRHTLYFIWQQLAFSFQSVQCHSWQQIAINIPLNSVSSGLTTSLISCQFNLSRILSFWTNRMSVKFHFNIPTLVHRTLSGPAFGGRNFQSVPCHAWQQAAINSSIKSVLFGSVFSLNSCLLSFPRSDRTELQKSL